MTGPTHRQYSICFGCIALILFYTFGITNINYYLALPIVMMTSKAGALFPDVDHDWSNVHDKTVINKIINTLIHITGGKHRSWQTHSIDICVIYTVTAYVLPKILFYKNIISEINHEVLLILMLGFAVGWISHLVADMKTSAGVRIVCFSKFKIKIVPKHIGKLKFNTGHEWEAFDCKFTKILNIILGIICLIYPLFINGTIHNIINKIGGN